VGDGATLIYQLDGNLVVYAPTGRAYWATMTFAPPGRTVMQGDGNLVVYSASGIPVWWSGTSGHPGAFYVLQEGRLTSAPGVYSADCRGLLWSEPAW
jgi:hypothetical protein